MCACYCKRRYCCSTRGLAGGPDGTWTLVGKIGGSSKTVRIHLEATVPGCPGESLLGRLDVTANGGQRIVVAVSMTVRTGAYAL